ncbi:hypothetical protein POM88_008699 [Heracleum sosnowskyi]|uniref:DUF632 domain-containing protein n=1 Tax=Heracleum sosnowskyi TaxID=360622 RepID=A0AAD8N7L6_9APIA|nr:hypothetical protein POM88_008699 [Heracleum sosnowskyi]
MRVITWNKSFRVIPNCEGGKDNYDAEEYETHATVLDKLLAWEKKLYDEVKAGELMKLEYQRKVGQLNKLKKRGASAESLENTKAVNMTYSLTNIKHVRHLFLETNGFTGSVIFLSNLPLSDLDIQDNHSSGVIPEMFESIENLRIGENRFHRGENYPPWLFPLDTTPNITSPPSTESAVESYPSRHAHKHKKKRLGLRGIAYVVSVFTLLAACAAFFAVDYIQHRGRRLRHLEGNLVPFVGFLA